MTDRRAAMIGVIVGLGLAVVPAGGDRTACRSAAHVSPVGHPACAVQPSSK